MPRCYMYCEGGILPFKLSVCIFEARTVRVGLPDDGYTDYARCGWRLAIVLTLSRFLELSDACSTCSNRRVVTCSLGVRSHMSASGDNGLELASSDRGGVKGYSISESEVLAQSSSASSNWRRVRSAYIERESTP